MKRRIEVDLSVLRAWRNLGGLTIAALGTGGGACVAQAVGLAAYDGRQSPQLDAIM